MPNMDKIFKQASQNAKAKDAAGIKRSPIGNGAGVKTPAFNPSKPNNMGSVFEEAKKNAAVKDMEKNAPEKKLPPLFPTPVKPMARPWEAPLSAKPVSAPSKLDHMLYGAAKSTGAGYANFGGTMLDALQKKNSYAAGQQRRLDNDKTYLNSLKLQLSQTHHPVERAKLEETIRRKEKDIAVLEGLMKEQGKYTQKGVDVAQGKADEWARESAEHVAKAKDGMGKVGQFAVDLGVAGTQMLGDAVTGGLPSMFVRAAGSGMQEARLAGADIGKQMAYGLGSGALATATEKISNLPPIFKKAFGKGILDDAVKRLTGEFGATKAGQIITSALGEGGEELLESIVQPFLQRATYDPKAKFEAESALHDFLIGAAMGGIGGTAGVVQTSKLGKELNSLGLDAEDTKAFIDTGLESAEGTKSHALAERAQSKTKEDGTLSDYDLGSLYKANVGAVAEENGQKPVAPTYEPPEDRQEATQKPSDGLEAPKEGTDTPNAVNDILEHGKRVEQSKLTNDEFNSMADRGDVAMDAEQKIYKVNPEQHIDQRGPQHTRNPRVNAFQFDHPELHDYYAPAAQELLVELEGYQPGGQTQLATGEYGQTYSWRSKRQASTRIAALLDAGMSRDRIASALDAIINNHGAENYADAKRVEFILDDMLSNGYNDGSKFVPANQNYVNDKAAIPGNKSAEYGHGLDDIDADDTKPKIKVFRGFNRSQNPNEKNLASKQTIFDVLGKAPTSEAEMLPYSYYTESENDAKGYANHDQELMGELRENARKDYKQKIMEGKLPTSMPETDWVEAKALESYRVLTGRDSPSTGSVSEFEISPSKVLDLFALGNETTIDEIYGLLAKETGKSASDIDDQLVLSDLSPEDDAFNTFKVLRNAPGSDVGTRFYNFIKSFGYDAVRYNENGNSHYALLPEAIASESVPLEVPANLTKSAVDGDGLGAADAGSLNSDYDDLQAQSSEFYPEGANAARPVDTPVYGFDGRRISRAANNMMGAQAIPDDVVPELEQFTADGLASYTSESDQKALDRADSLIRSKRWDGAMEYFRSAVNEGKAGKDLTAVGMKLINNAANAKDGNALAELFTLYSKLSVNTAQGMQAMSMFRKLSPESQLYGIQKIAESIPRKIDTRRKRGKSENVPVEEWMQRTGELLAKRLEAITESEPERVQSLTESILSDITRYAKKGVTEGEKGGVRKRSEADRLYDLFNNYRQYNEAWDAAKAKIEQEYGDNPGTIKAFEDWLENDIASAAMSDSIGETVKISPELVTKFLEQTDQEGRNAVMQEIYQDIADQLPADFREKANAWRYMAMLLNPTTHIRNMMGNAIQAGTRNVKNAVKVAVEKQMGVSQNERTAAILGNSPADVARRGFAKTMYEQDLKAAMGERKWQDGPAGVMSQVQDIRQKQTWGKVPEKGGKWSPGAVTQAVINKGGNALEVEDKWFNERAYVQSLAQALKARGITAEEAQANPNDPRVMSAREYAITEAQKATYRNATQLSDALSKAGNYRGDNKVVKGASFAFNAIMPFRRTPANILTTSFDYSPIGIIKAVSHMGKKLESGEVTAAQVADELSAGLTGTGIMLVGAALAYAGLLQTSIGGGGDKKEKDFRRQTGEQDYSLNVFGHSYTLDWAVPTAMPLFAGAGFIEEAKDKDRAWTDLIGSLANVATEITFETSMLSAIDKIMKRVSYEENWPEYIASEVASSYASQFIPTVGGKVASIFDPSVRRTETSEGAGTLQKQAERFVQSAQRKIPGARNMMEPMIDRWGQEVSNGSPVGRTFQALVSPGFMKPKSNDAVDKEILRLKESTSNSAVFPPAYAKKISFTDKDHILHEKAFTSKEYTEYSKAVGQSRKELLDSAVGSSWYKAMPDGEKAEYLHDLYSYSKAQADWKYGIMSGDDWMHNVKDAQKELGVSPAQFIALASEYGSRAFSGKPYENLKSVLKTGLPIEDYFRFKEEAKGLNTRKHKTKDGWKQYSTDSIDSREVDMWAKKNGLTREQKNALKKTI